MKSTSNLLVSCFFCLALFFVSGCGKSDTAGAMNVADTVTDQKKIDEIVETTDTPPALTPIEQVEAVPTLTPAEQAEVDKYIKEHGRAAILYFLEDWRENLDMMDEQLALKYVKYLVSQGADVSLKNSWGQTPLDIANKIPTAISHEAALAKYLVSREVLSKIDKDITKYGKDAILQHYNEKEPIALWNILPDLETLTYLISKGVDVDVNATLKRPNDEDIPLILAAAIIGNFDVVKFLVSKGADVNAKTSDGATPLHGAASHGNVEAVKFLVSKGADVNAEVNESEMLGGTPLDIARWRLDKIPNEPDPNDESKFKLLIERYSAIIEYLKSKGGKSGKEL